MLSINTQYKIIIPHGILTESLLVETTALAVIAKTVAMSSPVLL